ncbi:HD-GYP domain-containing protein [Clostridium kluyveri]|uniref:HD-GYP domain-containing protein n=1 Tax=Clostridium kluyveri TaxID=1534 RepID=UPI003A4C5DCC
MYEKLSIEGNVMGKYRKILRINDLKVGMICAKELMSEGKILIGKGMPITEWAINKLKDNYFYNEIEIYCEDNNDIDNNHDKKIETIEQIKRNFDELSGDVQDFFENLECLHSSSIEEVRKFAVRIQQELKYTNLIIKNIVLYGSGNDAIYKHSVNVATLSYVLGKWSGLSKTDLNLLTYSAVLHDFGKTKIDKNILDKPGSLTLKEFDVIKQHPITGYNYIKQIKFLNKSVSFGILMHHEKCDGSGYPLGLKGDKIHQFGKIIAIADMFDAVNSDRIHKKSKNPLEVLELIQKESLVKLDYEYCNIFLSHVINYYIGENVLLNNGLKCKIIQIDINNIGRPLLLNGTSFIDLKKQQNLYIKRLII